jgi:hypothetical protein
LLNNHCECGSPLWNNHLVHYILPFKEGASVTGLSVDPLFVATEETLGGVKAATAGESDTVEVKFEILFMYYWLHDTEQRKKVRMQNRGAPVILHPWN